MKTLITTLALALLVGCGMRTTGHVAGIRFDTGPSTSGGYAPAPVVAAPVMGAPTYGAPGNVGYAPYGSVYAGTTFDYAMASTIVADDMRREAARHPVTTPGVRTATPSPPSAPAADGSPYATRADLGVLIDQVLDDHAAVRALRREVESRP